MEKASRYGWCDDRDGDDDELQTFSKGECTALLLGGER
jgi:hypothetical protein